MTSTTRHQAAGEMEVLHQVLAGRHQVADHRHQLARGGARRRARARGRSGAPSRSGGSASWSTPRSPCRRRRRCRERRRRDDVARASGRPRPSRRCAGPRARTPSGLASASTAGIVLAPAATGRARRSAAPSSRRFPSCCRCRSSATRRLRHLHPFAVVDLAGAVVGLGRPGARAGAQRVLAPAALQHRPRRHEDRRHVRRRRAIRGPARSCRNRRGAPTPSTGWARIASSASIASRLR